MEVKSTSSRLNRNTSWIIPDKQTNFRINKTTTSGRYPLNVQQQQNVQQSIGQNVIGLSELAVNKQETAQSVHDFQEIVNNIYEGEEREKDILDSKDNNDRIMPYDCQQFNRFDIPEDIINKYREKNQELQYVSKGIINELNCCYFILNNELYLWQINNFHDIYENQVVIGDNIKVLQFNQQIQELVVKRDRNAHDHLLIIALQNEIVFLRIDQNLQYQNDRFEYRIEKDFVVNCMNIDDDERIFIAAENDVLYELVNVYNNRWKLNNVQKSINNMFNVVKEQVVDFQYIFAQKNFKQISVDRSKQLLYGLLNDTYIHVYDISDNQLKYLFMINKKQILQKLNYQLQHEISIVEIQKIDGQWSNRIDLQVITNNLRIYIRFNRKKGNVDTGYQLDRQFTIEMIKQNDNQIILSRIINNNQIMLEKNQEEQDYQLAVYTFHQNFEFAQKVNLHQQQEIQEDNRIDEISQSRLMDPAIYEIYQMNLENGNTNINITKLQFILQPLHFLLLTERVLYYVIQQRPVDILFETIKQNDHSLFIKMQGIFGYIQTMIMLMQIYLNGQQKYYQYQNEQISIHYKSEVEQDCFNLINYFQFKCHFGDQKMQINDIFFNNAPYQQFGQPIHVKKEKLSVFVESVFMYYLKIYDFYKDQKIINEKVYNYQENRSLSSFDKQQLQYFIDRLQELRQFLKQNNNKQRFSMDQYSSLIQTIDKHYQNMNIGHQNIDVYQQQQQLGLLEQQVTIQIQYLNLINYLNNNELRLAIERLDKQQKNDLLSLQFKDLVCFKNKDHIIIQLLIYYLVNSDVKFQLKKQLFEQLEVFEIVPDKVMIVAHSILQIINAAMESQEQTQFGQKKKTYQQKQKDYNKQNQEMKEDHREKFKEQLTKGQKINVINQSVIILEKNIELIDLGCLFNIYEYLNEIGGFVQFNQLLLAKMNKIDSKSQTYLKIQDFVVELIKSDNKQMFGDLSSTKKQVLVEQMLKDIIKQDNKTINEKIIEYLYHQNQFQMLNYFSIDDVVSFYRNQMETIKQKIMEDCEQQQYNLNRFMYFFYNNREMHNEAYQFMWECSNQDFCHIYKRIEYINNCKKSFIQIQGNNVRTRKLDEQLEGLEVQNIVLQECRYQNNQQYLKELEYQVIENQTLYEICDDLEFLEGKLYVFQISDNIGVEDINQMYQQLFEQYLQIYRNNLQKYIQQTQYLLKRLCNFLKSNKYLNLPIMLYYLEQNNKQHAGYSRYLQNDYNSCYQTPFWIVEYLVNNCRNVKIDFERILEVYEQMYDDIQKQANIDSSYLKEMMYPINAIQATIQVNLTEVKKAIDNDNSQQLYVLQKPFEKIRRLMHQIEVKLEQLLESCQVSNKQIEYSQKTNQNLKHQLNKIDGFMGFKRF